MRDKALQKIEQLKHSFSADLEDDPRVRQLFVNAGLALPALREEHRSSANAPPTPWCAPPRSAASSRARAIRARCWSPRSTRLARRWQYSRCLAALATPGKPPSLVVEYCSPEVPKSERAAMVRLLALSQRLTADRARLPRR